MTDALNKLYCIEVMPDIIAKFDTTRAALVKEQLEEQYAEIMSMLFENMAMVEPANAES